MAWRVVGLAAGLLALVVGGLGAAANLYSQRGFPLFAMLANLGCLAVVASAPTAIADRPPGRCARRVVRLAHVTRQPAWWAAFAALTLLYAVVALVGSSTTATLALSVVWSPWAAALAWLLYAHARLRPWCPRCRNADRG